MLTERASYAPGQPVLASAAGRTRDGPQLLRPSETAQGVEPSMLRFKRRRLLFVVSLRKHMRFLSTKPVGAWRNGRASALGVPGAYAV